MNRSMRDMDAQPPFQGEEDELAEEVVEEIETELEAEIRVWKDRFARSQSDMANMRKRMEREVERAEKYAQENFISAMLPAKDAMEKGVSVATAEEEVDPEKLLSGIVSTLNICDSVFSSFGITEIAAEGEVFNPEVHEAMCIREVEGIPPDKILTVYQKGYMLNDRLLRAAKVEVSC